MRTLQGAPGGSGAGSAWQRSCWRPRPAAGCPAPPGSSVGQSPGAPPGCTPAACTPAFALPGPSPVWQLELVAQAEAAPKPVDFSRSEKGCVQSRLAFNHYLTDDEIVQPETLHRLAWEVAALRVSRDNLGRVRQSAALPQGEHSMRGDGGCGRAAPGGRVQRLCTAP